MYLVINRRPGESFTLTTDGGERIEIFVSHVSGGQSGYKVKLAIAAEKDVTVLRDNAIRRANNKR